MSFAIGNSIRFTASQEETNFLTYAQNACEALQAKPLGKRLVEELSKSSFLSVVRFGNVNRVDALSLTSIYKESGSGSNITLRLTGDLSEDVSVLAHVLIHSLHNAQGQNRAYCAKDLCNYLDEEHATISGFPAKPGTQPPITENGIREENGLPQKPSHPAPKEKAKGCTVSWVSTSYMFTEGPM
jgi:hypothetical protein